MRKRNRLGMASASDKRVRTGYNLWRVTTTFRRR
jgi:hypothetical protein